MGRERRADSRSSPRSGHVGPSDAFKDLLGGTIVGPKLARRDEQGVELYYNAALTLWCHLTGDLQIGQPSIKSVQMTVVAGTQLKIDF